MSSFLEKLKKGMQQEVVAPATADEIPEQESSSEGIAVLAAYKKNTTSPDMRRSKMITKASQLDEEQEEPESEKILAARPAKEAKKVSKKTMVKKLTQAEADNEWLNNEGQLAVNVYQTENDLVIQAAIAGIKVEDLDVLIEDEVITIKGNRPNPIQETGDYFIEECYWGNFSRKIILPVEVDSSRADAAMKEGILTIRIPKVQREKKKRLIVK